MVSREVKLKGQAFRGLCGALRQRHGDAVHERVLAAMPGEAGQALRYGSIVAGGWYPIAWYRELHAAIQQTLGKDPETPRQLSRLATKNDINGVYRFVLSFLSPGALLSQWPRIWGLYCDGGKITTTPQEAGVQLEFSGCIGHDRLIWLDLSGGIEAMLEACHGKASRVKLTEHGEPHEGTARMLCSWQQT